jgi:hypothetical protein
MSSLTVLQSNAAAFRYASLFHAEQWNTSGSNETIKKLELKIEKGIVFETIPIMLEISTDQL